MRKHYLLITLFIVLSFLFTASFIFAGPKPPEEGKVEAVPEEKLPEAEDNSSLEEPGALAEKEEKDATA